MDKKSGKIKTETYSGVFVHGLRIPSRFSPCKTHSREMAQTSGFDPASHIKTCFDCKMFDVAYWVACLNRENGPGGTPSHEALSVSPQGALEIPSRFSPCKTHSREMAQTSGFDPASHVKTCFDCKMFDVAYWVACLNRENGPGGTPSHEALSVSPQGALEISSVAGQPPSLDRNDYYTPRLVAEPHKRDDRFGPSSQRPQHPTLYRHLKRRLGRSLKPKFYKGSVVRRGKKATHKYSRIEGDLTSPSKLQGPLNSGSLHKQARRNSLSRDVRTPVEDHDMVPSLSHNTQSQTHSRVSECDGRPSVQVIPSSINRIIQSDMSEVVHPLCRSICHSSEPQTSIVHVSNPRPKCLGHRCSKHKLVGSHCLCLLYSQTALPNRVIQKTGSATA